MFMCKDFSEYINVTVACEDGVTWCRKMLSFGIEQATGRPVLKLFDNLHIFSHSTVYVHHYHNLSGINF